MPQCRINKARGLCEARGCSSCYICYYVNPALPWPSLVWTWLKTCRPSLVVHYKKSFPNHPLKNIWSTVWGHHGQKSSKGPLPNWLRQCLKDFKHYDVRKRSPLAINIHFFNKLTKTMKNIVQNWDAYIYLLMSCLCIFLHSCIHIM